MQLSTETRNERLLERCNRDLTEYAAGRKAEVEKGRETPEFAALLVQKYGYGMAKTLSLLTDVEEIPKIDKVLAVDEAVASINPDWQESDKKRWGCKTVGLQDVKNSNGCPISPDDVTLMFKALHNLSFSLTASKDLNDQLHHRIKMKK